MKIAELRKRSNAFVANIEATIAKVVNFNEDLEQLNKDQLSQSKLANDQAITPDYSPYYAAWKSENYPQSFTGKPNLKLTGELYDNMDITAKGREYSIISSVPYARTLAVKYSDLIFGIAPSNQRKAHAITTPLLTAEYRKQVLK